MGHGLKFPVNIDEWNHWQSRRSVPRRLPHRLRAGEAAHTVAYAVVRGGPDADICVVVDAAHASVAAAIIEPLAMLPPERTIVVLGPGLSIDMGRPAVPTNPGELGLALRGVTTILGSGHYTSAGAAVWAALPRARSFVSQHGALTPFTPPLPGRTTVLAWTEADGAFWRSGRTGIDVESVGSQLLWKASGSHVQSGTDRLPPNAGPLTYLGQGHAAEISRARTIQAALTFCRNHDAIYRPHPSERDRLSLLALAAYKSAGIVVDANGVSLADLANPVISVFSTGVLEAAARGRNAWVDFPRPPAWLGEFWERYSMSRYGADPTPAPFRPIAEPAQRIADIVTEAAS